MVVYVVICDGEFLATFTAFDHAIDSIYLTHSKQEAIIFCVDSKDGTIVNVKVGDKTQTYNVFKSKPSNCINHL